MSEQAKDQNRLSDARVVVYGEPQVKTVTPHSGPNAGKEVDVLSVRVRQDHAERLPDGTWEKKDSDWFDLQSYNPHAKELAAMLKDGMALRVSGIVQEREYTGKDGQQHQAKSIAANSLAIDMLQPGLKGVTFEKPIHREQAPAKQSKGKDVAMER